MPRTHIPKLVNGRGTFPLDFTYARGRIRVATGTTDPKVYRAIRTLLDELNNVGNFETLDRIRNGTAKLMDVYAFYQDNGKKKPYTAAKSVPLKESVRKWLDSPSDRKASTMRGYASHLTAFLTTCTDSDLTSDIPRRLRAFREARRRDDFRVGFNHTRNVLKTFARDTVSRDDDLYKAIVAIEPIAIPHGKRKVSNKAVSVAEVIRLTEKLRDDYAQMVWAMCYTGMRPGEYFELHTTSWDVQGHTLHVRNSDPGHGNKGGDRTGIVPFAIQKPTAAGSPLVERQRRHRAFTSALITARKAASVSFTPHTGRKCAANWMAEAGVPQHRVIAYLGHESRTITQRYQDKSDAADRKSDVEAFRQYILRTGREELARFVRLSDAAETHPNPEKRQKARDLLALSGPRDLPRNPFENEVLDETMAEWDIEEATRSLRKFPNTTAQRLGARRSGSTHRNRASE